MAYNIFNKKFAVLTAIYSETKELGYDMLWQEAQESTNRNRPVARHAFGRDVEPTEDVAGG